MRVPCGVPSREAVKGYVTTDARDESADRDPFAGEHGELQHPLSSSQLEDRLVLETQSDTQETCTNVIIRRIHITYSTPEYCCCRTEAW